MKGDPHEIPGTVTAPPLFLPGPLNDRLWPLGVNRIDGLNEQLVTGREDVFYRWEFDAAPRGSPTVIDYSVQTLSNPDSLRGSFGWYRAIETSCWRPHRLPGPGPRRIGQRTRRRCCSR